MRGAVAGAEQIADQLPQGRGVGAGVDREQFLTGIGLILAGITTAGPPRPAGTP
ncbi:hypothetical protein [Streptomyces sp. NPDC096323]|uniref:hypothetical protein n=1 Tax=Streptomyces sp. NPDC096323 TaxID=3155822 RepID=UPI003317FA03